MEKALDIAKNNLPVKGFLDLKDIQIPQGQDLIDAILKLKKEKNAVGCGKLGAGSLHQTSITQHPTFTIRLTFVL
jgi:hypothetical protein